MAENGIRVNNDTLRQQASKGAFWGLSGNIIVSAISFAGTVILARILSPKDFGLLGMAMLITGIVQLFGNLGLGAALVHKKDIDDEYLSTAFWSSLFVSVGLTILSIIVSPLAAMFFNEPLIKWIIICLSANFIISSSASIHRTLLYKDIRIKKIAFIEVISRVVRVVIMLACALAGMGVWSIVIGMIVECAIKTIIFITTSSRWMPTFYFSKPKFKELFRYGKNIYGQGFLGYFNQNMDFIVTGRCLGANLLGYYQFSYNLPYLVKTYVNDGIGPVAFPVFSKAQDDNERLARGFFSAVRCISMITFPLMVGLAFCADDFISVVYGVRWLPAAVPLKFLCFGAALASVHCIVSQIFNAKGRPDIGLKWGLFILPVTIASVVLFSRWGIIGVAGAMLFVEVLTIYIAYIATRLIKVKFVSYLKVLLPAVSSSLIMAAILFLINRQIFVSGNIYARFAVNVLLGSGIYIVLLFMLYKKDLISSIELIRAGVKNA